MRSYTFQLLSIILCVFLISIGSTKENDTDNPTVEVKQGKLQGKQMKSTNGRQFSAFLGVPFAKANRFKAPEPADSWTGILNAIEDGPACIQYDQYFRRKMFGQEDCLTLNIYTPKLPNKGSGGPLPVMVFIHGGGFTLGEATSTFYGPERYLNSDIVLVVIQYRLGPFGFLSTGDEAASGNYGLMDQVQALKWVNENIKEFGGDSNRITISGESAGGASVIFHLLSPMSKGLFKSAIAQSGSALCPYAIQKNPLKIAKKIAEKVNCDNEDTNALILCLQKVDMVDILKAANDSGAYFSIFDSTTPVIENPKNGKFLTESPWKLFKEGRFNKVPLISGVTEDESATMVSTNVSAISSLLKGPKEIFLKENLPKLTSFLSNISVNIANEVYEEYYKNVDFDNQDEINVATIKYASDAIFKSCNDFTVRYASEHGVPVYMYVFDYATKEHSFGNYTGKPDAAHAIDLIYLFNVSVPPFNFKIPFSDEEESFSKNFVDMWVDFATTGNPTPNGLPVQWTSTPPGTIEYLRINTSPQMEHGYLTEKMAFWKKKYEDSF